MIDFPCHCGHKFSVGEDMAGGMLQCPQCGRLNDVPLLSDLQHLSEDGTYNLELLPEAPEEDRVSELTRLYRKGRTDDQGEEIDLRPTMQDIYNAGGEVIPLEPVADDDRTASAGAPPKYDPLTGELIVPVDVQAPAKPPPAPPIASRPALAYGSADGAAGALAPVRILLELFRPVNVVVMLFVCAAHVLIGFIFFLLAAGALLIIVLLPALIMAIIAHYGNVVDETGPAGHDELPTPLRGLNWHDDLWGPFRDWMLAMLLCYGPALAMLIFPPPQQHIAIVLTLTLAAAGTVAAPAALLTALTSGTIFNLRPDRLLGVIFKCGLNYVVLVMLWAAIIAIYFWSLLASVWAIAALFGLGWASIYLRPILLAPMLLSAIYLTHYFCWYLGLMYRAHHGDFPWVYQRHAGKIRREAGFAVMPPAAAAGRRSRSRAEPLAAAPPPPPPPPGGPGV